MRKAMCTVPLLTLLLAACSATSEASATPSSAPTGTSRGSSRARFAAEYATLYASTSKLDRLGLESIRALHEQLDDDQDGTIEPSETGDFLTEELKSSSPKSSELDRRRNRFHQKDSEISVQDLWKTWHYSEVYNWTNDQMVVWLENSVQLPEYSNVFRELQLNGTVLPVVATNPSGFLSKVVGVANPIHRSKLTLKAMDVVLFGPPKEAYHHTYKEAILTTLLLLAITGLLYTYRVNQRSQLELKRMVAHMEGLNKAESELKELQERLQSKSVDDEEDLDLRASDSLVLPSSSQEEELRCLRNEIECLKNELMRAEVELEDKCWVAPSVLQHWLQLTYELESLNYNRKRKMAESQLEQAKELCERIKRKRSSLVGAFVVTHNRSIDDVDKSILDAKSALMEVTKDLTERTNRWRQIELLCGCTIVNNPGINALQQLVKHVGSRGFPSKMTSFASSDAGSTTTTDELARTSVTTTSSTLEDNSDARSMASSSASGVRINKALKAMMNNKISNTNNKLSREASKDSSESESQDFISTSSQQRVAQHRRLLTMKKSLSQDEAGVMAASKTLLKVNRETNNTNPSVNSNSGNMLNLETTSRMTSSASESDLRSNLTTDKLPSKGLTPSKTSTCIEEENGSASDSGSVISSDSKKKKRLSFLNFGKKHREKKDIF